MDATTNVVTPPRPSSARARQALGQERPPRGGRRQFYAEVGSRPDVATVPRPTRNSHGSGAPAIQVEVEVARAGSSRLHQQRVPPGTLVRDLLRAVGEPPEGSAVLVDGVSVPLDTPLSAPTRLVVIPTFSGG